MFHSNVHVIDAQHVKENIQVHNEVGEGKHSTRSRENELLKIPNCRLETCRENLRIRGSKMFNEIPKEIRTKPTHSSFKSSVKRHVNITQQGSLDNA